VQLSNNLTEVFRLTDSQKSALRRLGIETVRDLFMHFPSRYESGGDETTIGGLVAGMDASVIGTLEKLQTKKSWKRRIPVSEGFIADPTGRVKVMWFNQPYIAKMFTEGMLVRIEGKVSEKRRKPDANDPSREPASSPAGSAPVSQSPSLLPKTSWSGVSRPASLPKPFPTVEIMI